MSTTMPANLLRSGARSCLEARKAGCLSVNLSMARWRMMPSTRSGCISERSLLSVPLMKSPRRFPILSASCWPL